LGASGEVAGAGVGVAGVGEDVHQGGAVVRDRAVEGGAELARRRDELAVAPEVDGDATSWSPEHLLLSAIGAYVVPSTGEVLNAADGAVTSAGNSTVQYSLDKKPKDMWNFIIGSQFQINRSWMIRAEVGILGSRTQVIAGLQYRFDL